MSSATPETQHNKSGNKVPPLMWAFTIVFALGSGLGGYIIGERDGQQNAIEQFAAEKPQRETKKQPSSIVDAAVLPQDVELQEEIPEATEPGSGESEPKPLDDGTFDATIFGPGDEITGPENISNSARRDPNDPFAIGAVDAPVVIAEFSDWNCSYCLRYGLETEPSLIKEYVDAGYVRIEWNDMPVHDEGSIPAAKAGRAAAEQGKFAEYKEAYLEKVAETQQVGGFDIDDFVEFAEKAGVEDLEKFRADAESDKYDEALAGAQAYASEIGVKGTPGFIVNDVFLAGAYPLELFRTAINLELEKAAS